MLTSSEIVNFIQDDIASAKKQRAKVGLKYYEGEHDILNYRLNYNHGLRSFKNGR